MRFWVSGRQTGSYPETALWEVKSEVRGEWSGVRKLTQWGELRRLP